MPYLSATFNTYKYLRYVLVRIIRQPSTAGKYSSTEFSPNGYLFTLGSSLKITEIHIQHIKDIFSG
jgi:hypothetical protein